MSGKLRVDEGSLVWTETVVRCYRGEIENMDMPHGITIGSIHTWKDLYLIPVCRPIVQAPTEKTMTLDIEGLNGMADLSHSLTEYPVFNDREGSWQFYLDTERYQEEHGFYGPVGNMAYRDTQQKLLAEMKAPFRTKVILDDEPLVYYIGRVWVSGKPSYQYDHAKITLQYRLYPFKYLVKEPNGDWLWDPFCFETDLATPQMKNVAIKAGEEKTFTLVDSDKPSAVFVTSSGKAAAMLGDVNGGNYTLITEDFATDIDATEGIESTELVYFFQTRQHRLSLEEVKMPVALMAGNFIGSVWNSKLTVTLGVRRKGSTVLLAAVVWKGMVNDYYGKTVTVGGAMKAALEPNTSYEFVLTGETEGFLVGNNSIRLLGTVTHDGEEKPNESSYVQLKAGSTELKEGTGIRTWFGGTMSFYAGDGAVLTPEKTVNIGTMDATLNRSGRTVVVQADEAIMVSVEYRPAFL